MVRDFSITSDVQDRHFVWLAQTARALHRGGGTLTLSRVARERMFPGWQPTPGES